MAVFSHQVGFKGLFMRHLQYFLEYVNDDTVTRKYSDWIGKQATAVMQNSRNSAGDPGSIWWGKTSASQFPSDTINHYSSGMDAVLASLKVRITPSSFRLLLICHFFQYGTCQ